MKLTGDVARIELDNIRFVELKGVESRCTESLESFKEGEKVIVISTGKVKNESIELSDDIYFVKSKVAGDFLARFLDNLNKKIDNSIDNH